MDEKSSVEGLPSSPSARPPAADEPARRDRDDVLPFPEGEPRRRGPSLRDLHDPFEQYWPGRAPAVSEEESGLIDPFGGRTPDGLRDPYEGQRAFPLGPQALVAAGPPGSRVRAYGQALAAYRRALAAQAEEVSSRYEQGVASALAGRPREAVVAWDAITLDDGRVVRAKKSIQRIRTTRD
jgi:hypothetical protein